jgi:hypothetical protein
MGAGLQSGVLLPGCPLGEWPGLDPPEQVLGAWRVAAP